MTPSPFLLLPQLLLLGVSLLPQHSDCALFHTAAKTDDLAARAAAHQPLNSVKNSSSSGARAGAEHKNVVFMVMDDARPDLNYAYGQTHMHTPNMDRLAKEGMVFRHAYCQFAVCGPSRERDPQNPCASREFLKTLQG